MHLKWEGSFQALLWRSGFSPSNLDAACASVLPPHCYYILPSQTRTEWYVCDTVWIYNYTCRMFPRGSTANVILVAAVGSGTPERAPQTAADPGSSCCTAPGHGCRTGDRQVRTGTSAATEGHQGSGTNTRYMLSILFMTFCCPKKKKKVYFLVNLFRFSGCLSDLGHFVFLLRQRPRHRERPPAQHGGRRGHRGAHPWQISGVCSHGAARVHLGAPLTPA